MDESLKQPVLETYILHKYKYMTCRQMDAEGLVKKILFLLLESEKYNYVASSFILC